MSHHGLLPAFAGETAFWIAALLAGSLGIVAPASSRRHELQSSIRAANARIEGVRSSVAAIGSLSKETARARARLEGLRRYVEAAGDRDAVAGTLRSEIRAASLTILEEAPWVPVSDEKGDLVVAFTKEFTARGVFGDLARLLEALEARPQPASIDHLRITRRPSPPGGAEIAIRFRVAHLGPRREEP